VSELGNIDYKDRTVWLSVRVMSACDWSAHSAGQYARAGQRQAFKPKTRVASFWFVLLVPGMSWTKGC